MVGALDAVESNMTLTCHAVGELSPCTDEMMVGHNHVRWRDNGLSRIGAVEHWDI